MANVSSGSRKNGFDAYGDSMLTKKDMEYWANSPHLSDPKGVAFELGEEIEYVEAGFFEMLPTISQLWILNSKCKLQLTDEEVALFCKNNVIIRGRFDTVAENLARKLRLPFLHIDEELSRHGDYYERGIDIITLRFYSDGSAYVNQDCRCQGSSAGSTGGGEVDFDLPKDFFRTMSAEDIAGQCWGCCYGIIMKNGILASLLGKAKKKGGFYIDYGNRE